MKKALTIMLLWALLLAVCNIGSASSLLNPADQYSMGLSMLRAYLSGQSSLTVNADGKTPLEQIIQVFQGATGHAEANGFLFYVQALDQIEKNNFDMADVFIDLLKSNTSLNALLEDKDFIREYGSIHPVAELEIYAKARRAEAEERYNDAISAYRECQNFYDSANRVMALLLSGVVQTTSAPTAANVPVPEATPEAAQPTAAPTPQPTATLYGISQNEVNSLNWTAVAGATQYTLEKRLGTGAYSQVYSGSATSYTDTSVIGNYQYTYRVTARLSNGTTVVSNEVSVMTSAAPHTHTWVAATCTAPKTCSGCGATEGSALGHNWKSATCTKPKTCSRCGATSGSALGHNWTPATESAPKTCTRCGLTEGSKITYGAWSAWSTTPVTATSTRKVETKTETEAVYSTQYTYTRWKYWKTSTNAWAYSYAEYRGSLYGGSGTWETRVTDSPLDIIQYVDGQAVYSGYWYNLTTQQVQTGTKSVVYYRYADRIQ